MNEQIKKLLKQATELAFDSRFDDEDNPRPLGDVIQEKFAELIIQECTSSLMTPKYIMSRPKELSEFNRGWVNGRLSGIEDIKEYFGVE